MQFAFARILRHLRIRHDFLIAKNAKSAQMDAKINRLLVQTAFVPATSKLEKQQSRQNTSGDFAVLWNRGTKAEPEVSQRFGYASTHNSRRRSILWFGFGKKQYSEFCDEWSVWSNGKRVYEG